MKHFLLLFGLVILTVGACSKKVAPPVVVEDPVIEEEIEEEIIVEEEEEIEIPVFIICEFRKTSCYGKCPSFSVKLYSDGKVIYHGKANVDMLGYFESMCTAAQIDEVFAAANSAEFFTLSDKYPTDGAEISDLPKTISYLKSDEVEKKINNSYGAPPALIAYEKWLNDFFHQLDWAKVKD